MSLRAWLWSLIALVALGGLFMLVVVLLQLLWRMNTG